MAACWCGRPQTLAGLIEIRGLGIRRLPFEPVAVVGLVVDLGAADAERLPAPRIDRYGSRRHRPAATCGRARRRTPSRSSIAALRTEDSGH